VLFEQVVVNHRKRIKKQTTDGFSFAIRHSSQFVSETIQFSPKFQLLGYKN